MIVKTINPTAFNGTFETPSATGSFNADGARHLTHCSGTVRDGETVLGQFNAWKEESFQYDFNGISDLTKLPVVAAAAQEAVEGITAELAQ